MNDARAEGPTPGSSSVEAYEEDWYRSLRALAERRRTELEQFEDEEREEPAEASAPGVIEPAGHTPGEGWAVPAPQPEPEAERAPSQGDVSRIDDAAAAPTVEASAGETSQLGGNEGNTRTSEPIESTDTVEPFDGAGSETEMLDAAATAETGEEVAPPTSPWARILKRLERIELAPLKHATDEVVATAEIEPPASDDTTDGGAFGGTIAPEAEASVADAIETYAEAEASSETTTAGTPTEPDRAEVADESISSIVPAVDADAADTADGSTPTDVGEAIEATEPVDDTTITMDDAIGQSVEPAPETTAVDMPQPVEMPPTDGASFEADGRSLHGWSVDPPSDDDASAGEEATQNVPTTGDAFAIDDASELGEAIGGADVRPGEAAAPPVPDEPAPIDPEHRIDPERARPSLTSRDATERRTALAALSEREPTAAELETVATLILDRDAEIRRLAIETLSRAPSRLDDAVVRQTLQDPADEVRAAAVRAAATRGIRYLPTLAPLVDARGSPETHRTVLQLLPEVLGEAQLTAESLDPLLLAIARMQPPLADAERAAMSEIAASIGTALLIEGVILPDARRLGAVRLLAGEHSHAVLCALAERAGDPLEEVRQAGLAAAAELARLEAETARVPEPSDIATLAEDLRSPEPHHAERALAALTDVDRTDVVTWCRARLAEGDAESVAIVASVTAVLELNEIGVELLTRGASLPSERRRPVVEALADFRDASRLVGFLAAVPSDRRADAVRLVWEASDRRLLPELRNLLADPTADVRAAVVEIAREADDPALVEAVAGLLETDTSPKVRAAAVRTIAITEEELPGVIRALADSDPYVRATAVESMPSTPAGEVGPVLAHALTDLDERVRLAAIERLASDSASEPALAWSALRRSRIQERDELLNAFHRTNPNLVLEIALEHLHSPDQEDRCLAAEMMGWGGSQAAVEAAIRALGDPVSEVRRAAAGALGRLRDRSAVAALGNALADPDAAVRVGAVRALGLIDDEGVLSFLVAALKDPDHQVRETTSHVLTEWSSPAVAKRLAGVLAVPSLRDSAADLLRRIGPTSVELLIDVLIQGSAEIRTTVGTLLEQIVGTDEFLGRMDSLEPARRLRAIEALGAIAGPLAVDAMMRSLSDPDERIRLRATQLLGDLGDPIAADAIGRLVDDPVPDVAAAARYALETSLSRGPDHPIGSGS